VFGVGRDITDRKKEEEALKLAKEQAEAATKLKDNFISLVSHDLRSPISSIALLFSELGRNEKIFDGADKVFLEMINDAQITCETLIDTIDQLLDISRLQTGKIELRPFPFKVEPLVSEVFAGVVSIAKEKGVELVNEVPEELLLNADRSLVARVVGNLVSNALKFSGKGDKITVYVVSEQPLALAVKDSGAGVNQKNIPNLFKHDIKTSTVGTGGERGAGLGLPLSNDIMTLHGGDISVESAIGEGSVFYLNFPTENGSDASS
jgi:signal transduction histidine kinase